MAKDYRALHPGQWQVAQDAARFRYLVCGRGWGKDHFAISDLLKAVTSPRALQLGGQYFAPYVGPSLKQVRAIAWERIKAAIPPRYIRGKPHETNLEIRLKWGPKIALFGSDNVDGLRGPDIHHLVVTEFAFCRPELWTAVRPGLRTSADRALLITTPDGPNHAFELWTSVEGDAQWARYQKPTWDNPFHDRAGLDEARRNLSRQQFDQEYGADFAALNGSIYCDFSIGRNVHAKHPITGEPLEIDRGDEVLIGQDYNAGFIAAVLGRRVGDEIWITDEILTQTTIFDHADAVKDFLQRKGINHERQASLFSDASGEYNASNKETSDNVVMRKAGFKVKHDRQNPKVMDRIHAVQALILNGAGRVRLYVHPRCKETIRCLQTQQWNQWGKPDKAKGLDHFPDALGYLVNATFPLKAAGHARSI